MSDKTTPLTPSTATNRSSSAKVPITIRPDAAARLAELGMQTEMQQMIDRALQVVPELAAIEVEIAERYDTGGEPGVSIVAYSDRAFVPEDLATWDVTDWMVETFPPQVLQHLCLQIISGRSNAR